MFVNFVMKDKTTRPMVVTVANDNSENGVLFLDGPNDKQNLPDNVNVNLDMHTVAFVSRVMNDPSGKTPGTWNEIK